MTLELRDWEGPSNENDCTVKGTGHADDWFSERRHRKRLLSGGRTIGLVAPDETPAVGDGIPEEIAAAIEASKDILDLKDNFDGDGSPAYDEQTWQRATDLIRTLAARSMRTGQSIAAPEINCGPSGSIDLHWEQEEFELLVNIPTSADVHATFYGDDYGADFVKGTIPSPSREDRLDFLIEFCRRSGK